LAVERGAICAVEFRAPVPLATCADRADCHDPADHDEPCDHGELAGRDGQVAEIELLDAGQAQLAAYFAGERTEFDLPTMLRGGSGFDQAVWARIAAIPYGHTATYGQIASAVGAPDGARAVGVACHRNPLPILVPCHRVVGAGGKLVGFGGGLPRKQFLLELEARVCIARDFCA
jgi:methylated-DNA-[protein]-cysteine S-methyltransferase